MTWSDHPNDCANCGSMGCDDCNWTGTKTATNKPMEIRLEELKQLLTTGTEASTPDTMPMGQQIVVLDRGFVYVGTVTRRGDMVEIADAKNIRYWGTKAGLGELRNGPLKETKLDTVGTVLAPMRAVISFIACNGF